MISDEERRLKIAEAKKLVEEMQNKMEAGLMEFFKTPGGTAFKQWLIMNVMTKSYAPEAGRTEFGQVLEHEGKRRVYMEILQTGRVRYDEIA